MHTAVREEPQPYSLSWHYIILLEVFGLGKFSSGSGGGKKLLFCPSTRKQISYLDCRICQSSQVRSVAWVRLYIKQKRKKWHGNTHLFLIYCLLVPPLASQAINTVPTRQPRVQGSGTGPQRICAMHRAHSIDVFFSASLPHCEMHWSSQRCHMIPVSRMLCKISTD